MRPIGSSSCARRMVAPRPASMRNFWLPASTSVHGPETIRARDRRSGPEQGYLEIALAHHCCSFIPEASTTLAQWASCELTSWP